MAIQLSITDSRDAFFQTAYAKITHQSSDNNKDKTSIKYNVSIWANKEAYSNLKNTIDEDTYEVTISDLTSPDFVGLYTHLSQQEKYKMGIFV